MIDKNYKKSMTKIGAGNSSIGSLNCNNNMVNKKSAGHLQVPNKLQRKSIPAGKVNQNDSKNLKKQPNLQNQSNNSEHSERK